MFGPEEPGVVGAFSSEDPPPNETRTWRKPKLGGVTWAEDRDEAILLKDKEQQMVVSGARIRCLAAGILKNTATTTGDIFAAVAVRTLRYTRS
jgi:hypothetical protein